MEVIGDLEIAFSGVAGFKRIGGEKLETAVYKELFK